MCGVEIDTNTNIHTHTHLPTNSFGSGKKKEEKRQKKIQEVEAGGKLAGTHACVLGVCGCLCVHM